MSKSQQNYQNVVKKHMKSIFLSTQEIEFHLYFQ